MTIRVYGLCNIFYDAFYIEGLYDYFGTKNISFSVQNFPNFGQDTFAVIVEGTDQITKIIIDSRDTNEIDARQLEWCDVYGKVNYNVKKNQGSSKIIPIGPSFGIKIWNIWQTCFYGCNNFLRFYKYIYNKKDFIANYWRQYKRVPLSSYYINDGSSNNYIFFIGSLWKKEMLTNTRRAEFISACKENKAIDFEGGFAPRSNNDNFGYDSFVVQKRYSLKDYMHKIKKSAIVFNTPAVLSCHGWKLGEFLAMGKAIISNEHVNELPGPLIENVHLLYAENKQELDSKILKIIGDPQLKRMLEVNAAQYFQNHLKPSKVIQKLMAKIES